MTRALSPEVMMRVVASSSLETDTPETGAT
jgi:hypothetical protein